MSASSNGQAHGTITEQLREARDLVKLERAKAELTRIKAGNYSASRLLQEGYDGFTGYAFGDFVDPMDAFRDADLQRSVFPFVDRGYARRDGAYRPFLWSDFQLDFERSVARHLATKNRFAVGILENLQGFVCKTG